MLHLTPERLAAIADSPATLLERSHLADCAACAAELAAAQRVVRLALADVPAIEPPLTDWARLAPALRAEGLIASGSSAAAPLDAPARPSRSVAADITSLPRRGAGRWRAPAQIAAALALLVGGIGVGRATVSAEGAAPEPVRFASDAGGTDFRSTNEALQVLQRATDDYSRAVSYLAAHDSSVVLRGRDAVQLYQTRLDALDRAAAATQAALYLAPQDPVLNQYLLTTLGARDLTIQQMGAVVPVASTQRARF
jgi:hypothetical protein